MSKKYYLLIFLVCILVLSSMHKVYCQTNGEQQTANSLIEIVIQLGQAIANATNIEILKAMPLTTGLLVIAVGVAIAPYLVIAGLVRRKFQ